MYASTQTKGLDKAEWTVIEIVAWHSATFTTVDIYYYNNNFYFWRIFLRAVFVPSTSRQYVLAYMFQKTPKLLWIKIATTQALNLRLKVQPTQHSFFFSQYIIRLSSKVYK